MGREDEIKLIAYRLWEEDHRRHGHALENWLKAEIIWEKEQTDKRPSPAPGAVPPAAAKPTKMKPQKDSPIPKKSLNR